MGAGRECHVRHPVEQIKSPGVSLTLEASCPTEMPATPLARLSAIEQRLQTILAAIETVRGPLNAFYDSLSDEQKAQFNMIGRTAAKQG